MDYYPRFTKGEDTPQSSPPLKCGLLSAATALSLTTGAELETDLKGPLTATI